MLKHYKFYILLICLITFSSASLNVIAYSGIATKAAYYIISPFLKTKKVLRNDEIIRLSELSNQKNGTVLVGKELAKKQLSDAELSDAFIRIAIHQKKITRPEANQMYANLNNVSGFRTTLRKVIGNSQNKTAGHLNELKIANNASSQGYTIKGIGVKFDDGIKPKPSDIDVIISKNNKTYIIEAKDYAPDTKIKIINYRADLVTLIQYKKINPKQNHTPVFSYTNYPRDEEYIYRLQKEAEKHNVQLIFGSPKEQIIKISLL